MHVPSHARPSRAINKTFQESAREADRIEAKGGNTIMAYEELVKDTETQLVFFIEC